MSLTYRTFFGLSREAFPTELAIKDIMETRDIGSINDRLQYALRTGAVALVTGEVGSGKSTAIKYVISKLHPSEYKTLWITACSGSILEFLLLVPGGDGHTHGRFLKGHYHEANQEIDTGNDCGKEDESGAHRG